MGLHSSPKGTFPSYQTAINSCSTKTIYNRKRILSEQKIHRAVIRKEKGDEKVAKDGDHF